MDDMQQMSSKLAPVEGYPELGEPPESGQMTITAQNPFDDSEEAGCVICMIKP